MFNQQSHETLGIEYEFIPAGVLVPAKAKEMLFHARIPSQKMYIESNLSDSVEFAYETQALHLFLKQL